MHPLRLAASVFGVIFVAELPDKTALAALVLATRNEPLPVFLGASLALTVQSAVAVAAGSMLSLLPGRIVHVVTGAIFLVSAIVMLVRKEGEDEGGSDATKGAPSRAPSFWRVATTAFGVVFIAEWGDLTQFATAAFAAHEQAPFVVFAASTVALWAVTAIAVGIGHRASKLIDPHLIKRVAALLFALVGVAFLVGRL